MKIETDSFSQANKKLIQHQKEKKNQKKKTFAD